MADQPDDGHSDFMESYEPAPPAWFLMKEHIPESELPEIRGILGDALIDQCTHTYSEVEMWVQMWKDVCCGRGGGVKPPHASLADSPVVKELLRGEIRLLLLSLKEKAAEEGRDEEAAVSCYSPSVVNYAMSSSGQRARAQSAGSRLNPQPAPSRPQSAKSLQEVRSGSRLSAGSGCEDHIDAVKHKLNVQDVHEVVAHLRSVLIEDVEAMTREIQFLQECVEEKHQSHCDSRAPEPSVSELKEERKLIQKDLEREKAVRCPRPALRTSSHYALQQGCRPVGQFHGSSSGAVVCSSPRIFSKDKSPLARPPQLQVEPSLPLVSTSHLHNRVFSSSHLTQESSCHHGNELSRRCRDIPEQHAPHPTSLAFSAVPVAARLPGPLSDHSLGYHSDSTDSQPAPGSLTQEECAQTSVPIPFRYRPPGSPFPTHTVQPHPPAHTQTRNEDTATSSPISVLVPAPPAMQKPATRGQSVTRRLRLPHSGLVSPT